MDVDLENRSSQYLYYKVELRWGEVCHVACELIKGRKVIARAEGKCEWAEGKELKILSKWDQVKQVRPI